MQHNNKNIIIADKLDLVSKKIVKLDKHQVASSISEIHNLHKEIEQIAREYDLTTLLAIVDWVDLSTELNDDNATKIETLLTNDAFSNWLDVVVSLLRDYNDNLRPVIHQSLTAPQWLVKPSTILLKAIATWIAAIKIEHLSNTNDNEYSTKNLEAEQEPIADNMAGVALDQSADEVLDTHEKSSESIIKDQLKKAELASEEVILQQNVFEEIDHKVLEKDYLTSDVSDQALVNDSTLEAPITSLMETEINSDHDETLATASTHLSDTVLIDEVLASNDNHNHNHNHNNNNNAGEDAQLVDEISQIHHSLVSTHLQSNDVFSAKDVFIKHLDKLALITENTNLKSIVPLVDWTQRNLLLFQDNTTTGIEQFMLSGKPWNWIQNTVNCLEGVDRTSCLDNLTNSLTDKNWLEPLEQNELEAILVSIDQAVKTETSVAQDSTEFEPETDMAMPSSAIVQQENSVEESYNLDEEALPELLDAPVIIDNIISEEEKSLDNTETKETSGLKMTWDDDTHPELLMVYLEETPSQVDELLPLLVKISNRQASKDDKVTAARLAHTIKGGSAVVGITALADISSHLEELLEHSVEYQLNDNMLVHIPEIGKCINDCFQAVQIQGDEPETFLSNLTLLADYPYTLDKAISEDSSLLENVEQSIETELVTDDHLEDTNLGDDEISDEKVVDFEAIKNVDETTNTIDNNELTSNEVDLEDSTEKLPDDVSENMMTEIATQEFSVNTIDKTEEQTVDNSEEHNVEALIENDVISNKISNDESILTNTDTTAEDNSVESTVSVNDDIVEEDINSDTTDNSGLTAIAGMVATSIIAKEVVENVTENATENVTTDSDTQDKEQDETNIEIEATVETETLAKTEATIENEEQSIEKTVSETSGFNMMWHDDTHPELLMVYLEETPTQIDQLVPLLQKISENKADADEKHTASRMAHTIKGGSAIVGLTVLSEISYRLETLLDHSVKHQLPNEILDILPKAGACIEEVFEEVQMMGEEPEAYFDIFKTLDNYVQNIDENDDEVLELSAVALPDFILNQNNNSDSTADISTEAVSTDDVLSDDTVSNDTENETIKAEADSEPNSTANNIEETKLDDEVSEDITAEITSLKNALDNEDEAVVAKIEDTVPVEIEENTSAIKDNDNTNETSIHEDSLESEAPEVNTAEVHDEVSDVSEVSENQETETHAEREEKHEEQNEVVESVAVDPIKLDKLKTQEDVNNIIVEIDDIVMNLISHSAASDQPKDYFEKCAVELDRFELMTDLSGYPELSLLSKWCQLNLESHTQQESPEFTAFIQSNEIWSWVEHVGECLRESDDMSHMSSLSVELMREDWLNAIKMEDLQTVLLALRHLEDTGIAETAEITPKAENEDEVISWDKDVHPELLAVYFQETPDQIDHVAGLLHKISRGESTAEENKEAARIAHTIKGSSGVVGLNQLLELTHHLEDILDYSVNNDITPETAELLSEASDCMESLFETIQNKQAPPDELPSVLKSLSTFSGNLTPADKVSTLHTLDEDDDEAEDAAPVAVSPVIETTASNDIKSFTEKSVTSNVDTNEAFIRVPIKVIDKLLNLAGELVTTSNQVSDNLAKTQVTNKTIRAQDERVIGMLENLNKTIEQQEKDQQNLFSSMENSDFDSLEMDTYNELNSVASLLSEGILDSQEIDNTLSRQLDELSERLHSLDKLNKTFSDVILSSRMVTIDTIVPRLERIVRQTCRKTNKKAQLVVTGNNLNVDTDILNNLVDPLLHMLRNSIDHGIETPQERVKQNKDETGIIELSFSRDGNNILMSLKDDGAGINPERIFEKAVEKEIITPDQVFSDADAIKLILQPGFSTQENVTDISGRGVGMDVVNTSIQGLNGTMGIDSKLGEGTAFNLTIPLTLITNTTLLVKVEDNLIAIPTDTIEQIMYQQASTMVQRDDGYYVMHNDVELKTQSLGELLEWPHQLIDVDKSYNILIIKTDNETHAIHVDGIESSREVVVKRLSPWISPAKGVIGACHLNDGGVAPVINLITVANEAAKIATSGINKTAPKQIIKPNIKKKILVVDDSLSNRKALSLIIEKTEYDVITAVDGLDALRVMNENAIDLVFTDLEMPRMNGLELTQSIRAWNDKSKTPIVMITSRTTNKHRELAQKAGVDDYLTKPVETETLLASINTWLEAVKQPLEV